MIHQYKMFNQNIVLDICSGSIHVVDEIAYDMIAGFLDKDKNALVQEMKEKYPVEMVERAVKGMLPKGPLGRSMITKLHVYAGADHEQAAQKPEVLEIKF